MGGATCIFLSDILISALGHPHPLHRIRLGHADFNLGPEHLHF